MESVSKDNIYSEESDNQRDGVAEVNEREGDILSSKPLSRSNVYDDERERREEEEAERMLREEEAEMQAQDMDDPMEEKPKQVVELDEGSRDVPEELKVREEPEFIEAEEQKEPKVVEPEVMEEPKVDEAVANEEPKVVEPEVKEEPKVDEPVVNEEPKVVEPEVKEEPKVVKREEKANRESGGESSRRRDRSYSELDEHDRQRALRRAQKDEERRKEREERRKQREIQRERRRSSILPASPSIYSSGPSESEKQRYAEEQRSRFKQNIRPYRRPEEPVAEAAPAASPTDSPKPDAIPPPPSAVPPSPPASQPSASASVEERRREAIAKLREQEEEEAREVQRKREEEERRRSEEMKARAELAQKNQPSLYVKRNEQIISDDDEEDGLMEKPLPSGRRFTEALAESYNVRPERTSFVTSSTGTARNSIFEYAQYGDYKKMDAHENKLEKIAEEDVDEYQKEQQRVAKLPNESLKVYPYSILVQQPLPSDVDPKRREYHLSEEEFKNVFSMSRSKYESLPAWKRIMFKKQARLF